MRPISWRAAAPGWPRASRTGATGAVALSLAKAMDRDQAMLESANFLQEVFLTNEDITRCHGSLSKLARHLEKSVVITGGMAAGWHLLKNGVRRKKTHLNDIDVVVEGLPILRTSLSQDFLIRHFHPNRGRGKILIQLVDEEHGTRIDVFTPGSSSLTTRLTDSAIGDLPCRIVSAEDLLAKLLSVIYPTTTGASVKPKYVESFHLLSTVADLYTVRELWREYGKEGQHLDFEEAVEAVQRSITANPGLLRAGHYSQDINQTCQWCCESESFPLASRSKIYEIIGYV